MFGRRNGADTPVEPFVVSGRMRHHADVLAELHVAEEEHEQAQWLAAHADDLRAEAARAVDASGARLGAARRVLRRVAEGHV